LTAVRFAAGFRAGDFRAVDFRADVVRLADLLADFLDVVLRAVVLRAGRFRAVDFRAEVLRAADLLAGLLRALDLAEVFRAVVLRAFVFRAVDLRAAVFRAVDFRAGVFLALVFRALERAAVARLVPVLPLRAPALRLDVRFFPLVFIAMVLLRFVYRRTRSLKVGRVRARITLRWPKLAVPHSESNLFFHYTLFAKESGNCQENLSRNFDNQLLLVIPVRAGGALARTTPSLPLPIRSAKSPLISVSAKCSKSGATVNLG
jgi:hypothetical protein